ncbi:TPA: CO dehydrogenase/acetyl-CoA synthase complex subunit epsilon [Candidatus Bathyarchaeota archaeon]|nr:CO dehydrogenase/acetyl-CoA synthase complex subunit epsilon [Candidatus Bathyarchaeota archaeon]
MAAVEPWQRAEIPGPTKGFAIPKPEVAVALIRRAKRPILIVGHRASEEVLDQAKLVDYAAEVAEAGGIPVASSGSSFTELKKRGIQVSLMSAVEAAGRLVDPSWKGLNGLGPHDLALFMGLPYYVEWVILSGIKHFSNVKTMSLSRFYQPHASWSFSNLNLEEWSKSLKAIIKGLRSEK